MGRSREAERPIIDEKSLAKKSPVPGRLTHIFLALNFWPFLIALIVTTLANAKKIHKESYTDWSLQEIAIQYVQYMEQKGAPKTLDGAFIGFLKKKVKTFKKDSATC